MKTKKEIVEAARNIIACYYQDNQFAALPNLTLESETKKLPEKEILSRWENLFNAIGRKP